MPKRRVVDHVQDGEVLLVDKQAVMPDKVVELSHHQAEKLRPKAPRTQAQIENTKRLVELNRKRAQEWKSRLSQPPASNPSVIVEDESKVAVRVKPKRVYNRKAPMWNSAEMDKASAAPPAAAPPALAPKKKREPVRPPPAAYYSSSEDEEEEYDDDPQPLPPPPPKPARKRLVKSGKRVYTSDTSESETTDTDVELHRVQKYVKKTTARMDAVKAIDDRLKQVSNKYVAAGLSVF